MTVYNLWLQATITSSILTCNLQLQTHLIGLDHDYRYNDWPTLQSQAIPSSCPLQSQVVEKNRVFYIVELGTAKNMALRALWWTLRYKTNSYSSPGRLCHSMPTLEEGQ